VAIRRDGGWPASAEVGTGVFVEDVTEKLSVDDLQLPAGSSFQGERRDAINVSESPLGGLVDEDERVRGEDGSGSAGRFQSVLDVLIRVFGLGLAEAEPHVDARPEGAVLGERELAPKLWKAHEDQRQQRFRVPLVVGEDVQMLEDVLMKQVRFVEQEDGCMRPRPSSSTWVLMAKKTLAAVALGARPRARQI